MKKFSILFILVLILSACVPSAPIPTSTPTATNTKQPTKTPAPTRTPRPSYTPRPTSTRVIPTVTVQEYIGQGDGVIELPKDAVGVLHIVGNSTSSYFGVEAFDAKNNQVDLFVNTTDPYDGRVPLNVLGDGIARLQVTASGEWKITYLPLAAYDHVSKEAGIVPLFGKGDDVWFFKSPLKPVILTITGNKSSGYFAVKLYGLEGSDLAVNTTDPYDGVYLYSASLGDLILIVITAEDDWTVIIQESIN